MRALFFLLGILWSLSPAMISCKKGQTDLRSGAEDTSPQTMETPSADQAEKTETGTEATGTVATPTPEQTIPNPRAKLTPNWMVYVGGGSNQIGSYRFDPTTGSLSLVKSLNLPNATPSFLAFHKSKPLVFAANESNPGGVMAFAINKETGELTKINEIAAGGGGPTHVAVHSSGKFLMAANYGSGQVTSYPILNDGSLGNVISNINAGTNAHQILSAPNGDGVFVPCLGSNYIAQYRINSQTGILTPSSTLALGTGGPRHMAFHPKNAWAYVLKELDSTIQALTFDANTQLLTTLGDPLSIRSTQVGANTGAEVQVHPSGSYVYASNRGDNSLALFSVNDNGTLTFKNTSPSGGATPRHFSILPNGQWILAANQGSGSVNVLKLDIATGSLSPTNQSIAFAAAQFVEAIDLNAYATP